VYKLLIKEIRNRLKAVRNWVSILHNLRFMKSISGKDKDFFVYCSNQILGKQTMRTKKKYKKKEKIHEDNTVVEVK
jgi:hypothetical protein